MPPTETIQKIALAVARIKKDRPNYPDHICGQVSFMNVEMGKVNQMASGIKYDSLGDDEKKQLELAAINVAAEAIRFLENLKK